eukprot:CAMPEP_0172359324 /NCGR_PEP_ID=MMETSP1060-20121228/3540_1 /TAXON_ID=37318 /ORGANISM="Pseudo-nitzschia pungens, Strain cf. cingulata" /LENGTH=78 /DNA_ID=CAMNT_0013080923 /DNA_START=221 /DNA_END=456 /DNA_ORIENTATION=+
MGKPKNQKKEEDLTLSKKDKKKVDKLQSQIPYHEGRGNKEEVQKIKDQIEKIWTKTKEAYEAQFAVEPPSADGGAPGT